MFGMLLIVAQWWIASRSLPADSPMSDVGPPPVSALDAIVANQIDPGPTSALTALGIDQDLIEADSPYPSSVTNEVAEFLLNCEAVSSQIKTSKVVFHRTIYNLVFETEMWSEGELYFESPDKQIVDYRSVKIPPGTKSPRLARSGHPFRLESGESRSWILTNDEIAVGNHEQRSYQRYSRLTDVPEHPSFWFKLLSRGHVRFPFLFEIHADQIRTDWTVTVVNRRLEQTVLKAIPRTRLLKQSFAECLILIDHKTWRVAAVKYFDSACNLETVYRLGERTVNEPLPTDCFDPAVRWQGYKEFKID